jgi:precorrin-2 C20-methyltransferase/precorrin-3B C17-methyltransferase
MRNFSVVGIGPGDPDLLTLKAASLIQRAEVIYHAGTAANEGRALEVIRNLLRPEQITCQVLTASMRNVSASDWKTHYRPGVDQIAADCRDGKDVVFVTEGDPTLYSTAAHVWQLLAELYPDIAIEIVPGVSSITAAAAAVGWPLAQKNDLFAVVPANYHADKLRTLIATFSTVCLLKVPQVLDAIEQTLAEFGPEREAVYLENVCTKKEWISPNLSEAADRSAYFSLILVRRASTLGSIQPAKSADTGKLWIVGLGPGDPGSMTCQAMDVLRNVEVIVGYDGYLQSLAPLGLRAELLGSPIGAESQRAAQALELAQSGKHVALVSSGDAGLYGMASLLLETAEKMADVDIEIVPGVTAAVSAASLLGAPLGHDFACISLSDLLTPWEVIERRLHAAAQGDFVVALYNPISQRRTWQLPRARDILLQYRKSETPVGWVDRAFRPGKRIEHTTLGQLTGAGVTMETTLIIGNSQTRLVKGRMVTPRGYGAQP